MIDTHISPETGADALPRLPAWVTSLRAETLEERGFLSGAALAQLHLVLQAAEGAKALLRDRLALRAAEACVAFAGRPERAAELRDALHLLRPGDRPGPAGEVYATWRRAVARPLSVRALHRALPGMTPDTIATWLDAGQGAPVTRAAAVLEAVLAEDRRAEAEALLLADAALARALGWDHLMPLLAIGVTRADLRRTGEDLRLACHRAVAASAVAAVREAADLARRVARLRAAQPKLRAKGAGAAVALFLARDAVAPAALTALMSDRAARRFCDRLVALGAARELTGRETFRLYGI